MQELIDSAAGLLPHGNCLLWFPGLLWTHVISDAVIALAYFSIPFALWTFVRRRSDLAFRPLFVMFALFILLCGLTHVASIWVIWRPDYWLDGVLKAATALVSIATAVTMWPLVPKALALPSPADLQRVNTELEARVRELESFSYTISHDMRAPLRAIDGYTTRVMRSAGVKLDPEGVRMLERAGASARQMGRLVDGLLAFSRLGREEMQSAPVDMQDLAAAACAEATERWPGVRFEVGTLPGVRGDPRLLRQVWSNLASNAAKFSSGGAAPLVRVSAEQFADRTEYVVSDNGVGFDMAHTAKLFGVFERLHLPDEFEGAGVGLAMVRLIVERHGGTISADARPGNGATFRFSLPKRG